MIAPADFFTQAETWITHPDEPSWRSAVSRAYYAAFHDARDFLSELGFRVPQAAQAHGYLWLRLSNCGDAATSDAGAKLHTLSRFRNRADYDIRSRYPFADADAAVTTAREVMEALALARIDPLRTQVRDAMRDYERITLRDVTRQGP